MKEGDPVLDLIAQRVREGSKPGKRTDGYKVGLVAQSGCLKCVKLGGELVATQALGLKDSFDAFYGDSAGITSTAYLLSDQTPEGNSIYYDFLPQNFINLKRVSKGQPLVDIPWMAYHVMGKMVPLNERMIADSEAAVHFYITAIEQGEIKLVDISRFKNRGDVLDAIHWTCRLPLLAGWPIEVSSGTFYTDGAVFTGGIPVDRAVKDGCTHILIYSVDSPGRLRKVTLADRVAAKVMNTKHPGLGDTYIEGFRRYAQTLSHIKQQNLQPPFFKMIGFEDNDPEVGMLGASREGMINAALTGFDKVMRAFTPYNLPVDPNIQVLR